MIAFVFPGQGAQRVGMRRALAESFPEARAAFEEADVAFGDEPPTLSTLCCDGPDDRPALTEITQPAMLTVQNPRIPIVANVDGDAERTAREGLDALVRQVSSPVQREAVVRRLASEGVTTYVEVGPGTVLGGLIKRIQSDARITHFDSPDELDAVMAACSS